MGIVMEKILKNGTILLDVAHNSLGFFKVGFYSSGFQKLIFVKFSFPNHLSYGGRW